MWGSDVCRSSTIPFQARVSQPTHPAGETKPRGRMTALGERRRRSNDTARMKASIPSWPDSDRSPSGRLLLRPRSVPPSRAHHRLRFRGIGLYFQVWYDRAAVVPPEDFSYGGKSATLWSGASCAFHTQCRRVRSIVSSGAPVVRIDASKDEATRGSDPGKENLTVTACPP
jgi:hypothetical protein